jgi:predicted nucleic acid-binding Zn ribbon protein
MPIGGLPDPNKHRVCMRCTKWFEPDEGSAAVRQSFGLSGSIADGIRNAAGDADLRFICHRCASVRRKRKLAIYGVLALALLWAVVKEAGWL